MHITSALHRLALRALPLLVLVHLAAGVCAKDNPKVKIRIDDIDVESKLTPKFQAETSPYAKSEHRWLQLMLTYELSVQDDEWVDRVALEWHVALTREKGKPHHLSEKVEYVDVEEGVCRAVIYLRPGFIRRYYGRDKVRKTDVLVHVKLDVNGAKATFTKARNDAPARWWDATAPVVEKKRDELLPRTKTPFAALDYDYYEHIRE